MNPKRKSLIIAVAIPLAVGILSALLTRENMVMFEVLRKPPLSPPGWLFPVVWTILYVLMGLASWLVYTGEGNRLEKEKALQPYGAQLIVNFFWSIIFFNWGMYLLAFVWLLLLWVLIVITAVRFYRLRPAAGYLMVPYILWVTFAGYLNYGIWKLNGYQ